MADDEVDCEALLAPFAQPARLGRLKAMYVRRFDNLPPETVIDGIQESIVRLFKFCRRDASALRDPNAIEAMLHQTIRRTLISTVRQSKIIETVSLDSDYVALWRLHSADDVPDARPAEGGGRAGNAAEAHARARKSDPALGGSDHRDPERVENLEIERIDTETLMARTLQELDDRYRRIVVQLLDEWTPDEIAQAFGKTRGYRLRDWARVKVCRIFGRLGELGNDLAARLHADGKCPHLLETIAEA